MTAATGDVWEAIRDRCEEVASGAALVTPVSGRSFAIEGTFEDGVAIRFRDSGEERTLWRDQFEVFVDHLRDGPVAATDLPPGVEPYASVASLLADCAVDDDALVWTRDGSTAGESPYLVSAAAARTDPERLHDDCLLLADALEQSDAAAPSSLETTALTDLYVLLSDVQREADRLRRSVREPLLGRLGPDQELHGRFGTVRRMARKRRRPRDDETVLAALSEHGIPHEWVLGVDPDKLDVVLAATDLTEAEVYDVGEQTYVQKTGVDEEEKYTRLQGLADRLDEIEGERGERLREELADLESRLDEALSA